ncbi:MAG: protein kinase [Myxococcaceae bacterium]|nr:protein kinase [Myxococcaceae bacterium]
MCGEAPAQHAPHCQYRSGAGGSGENDPLLGSTIGGYRVERRLGLGGMGAVYAAVETTIGKKVAIKVVHPHLTENPELPSLLAEARAVNAIGDKGIVDIHGWGKLPNGQPYLVMELLEGQSLETLLAYHQPLPWSLIRSVGESVLTSLTAAHQAGFIHRDIKPGNIFVNGAPAEPHVAKLLDFGLAERSASEATLAMGTPHYAPPELVTGEPATFAGDLYAVGCVLYEMATGQVPFDAPNVPSVLALHANAPRPKVRALRADAPLAFEALITSLLSIDPAGRPASSALARTALAAALPVSRSSRRWWLLAAAAALTALAVVIAFGPRTSPPVKPTGIDALERQVANMTSTIAARIDKGQLFGDPPNSAIDYLRSAEAAFPSRPEWSALQSRLSTLLSAQLRQALAENHLDEAERVAVAYRALGHALSDGGTDEPLATLERAQFAQRNGMAWLGSFAIDRYEYPNRAQALPATAVDWAEAQTLCQRARKRLCSEDEWQRACAGTKGAAFPYGDTFEAHRCSKRAVASVRPSGSAALCRTPEGVFDLSGNVAEWTATPFRSGEPQRVLRGGSFKQPPQANTCSLRDYFMPGLGGAAHIGFRCCL